MDILEAMRILDELDYFKDKDSQESKAFEVVRQYIKKETPELVSEQDPEDVYTIEEFRECVEQGVFNDFDGFGVPVIGDTLTEHRILPSQAFDFMPKYMSHIVWLNK